MNEFASLGLILLFALFAGHLVKFLRVPEVTGYIAAGILVGPDVFGWLTHDNLETLAVFSEVALGLILFSIGSVFEFSRMRSSGRVMATITFVESALAAILVAGGMLLVGQPWPVAMMLGAIAIETAAASTLMVMRECNSDGPLTDTLTGVIGMNNVLCLLAFSAVAAGLELSGAWTGVSDWYAPIPSSTLLCGRSSAPARWASSSACCWRHGLPRVVEKGETLILLAGCVLLCVGVSHLLDVSPLIATLSVGATMVNLSAESKRLFEALGQTDPALYAIFFVIAGTDLNILLTTLGALGVTYVVARLSGKLVGPWLATRGTDLHQPVRNGLGLAMLSQAGLAIGLTIAIGQRFPNLAPVVNTIVLASVVIFELIGPLSTRLALVRSGEARQQPELLDPSF